MLSKQSAEKLMDELLSGKGKETVTLVCGVHNHVYGAKKADGAPKPPNFKCKQCMFVEYLGLLINTPPDKREETVAMLEESTHHLIEAEKAGQIDKLKLLRHPKVFVNDKAIN